MSTEPAAEAAATAAPAQAQATPAPTQATQAQKWPGALWVVRHGQSAGNVARDAAEAAGLPLIDIATRDMDVPLSDLGVAQASALGRWIGSLPAAERPTVLLSSPYLRARQTMQLVRDHAVLAAELRTIVDERLREKEFGLLDRLTVHGIRERHPELAEQRAHVGKFYFRPPGGESWCDVILRLRSLFEMVVREHRGERVLLVSHQVIVNCLRYLLERLDEQQILDIDRASDVPNCAVTMYGFDAGAGRHGKLLLKTANFLAPMEEAGMQVTRAPDAPAAPKS